MRYPMYLTEKALSYVLDREIPEIQQKGTLFPHLSEMSVVDFLTKIREKGQLEKLLDKHAYTWSHRVDPLGLERTFSRESLVRSEWE